MFQHNDYTVKRLSAAQVQVIGKNRKAHLLFAPKGSTVQPFCPCKVMTTCGHQLAVMAFLSAEAQPQPQPKVRTVVSMEDRLTWA